jgi:lipopolysaccharide/colanic/teichoic acid biosynthesis glycosyltransferase/glycosyltransferase involved in cell wall biosynthesis
MMISVVVPAHNAGKTIDNCIRALQRQTIDAERYEIIIVDDDSDDDTRCRAEALGAKVIGQKRARAAAARNRGIAAASGAIVCFTDADCRPRADWLAEITAPLKDPEIIGCKGTYASTQRELVARFVQLEYEDKYDLMRRQPDIDFVDTYSAAYRREILLANGGFDAKIRFVEDQELSFRLAARGYKMRFQPAAVVEHLHSPTLRRYFSKKFNIGYWKAQIVRRYPERGFRDSHTPQILKIQMALIALLLTALAVTLVATWSIVVAAGLLFVFLATTLPFAKKAWPKDRAVALSAPALLAVRATALGLGYGWGTLRPLRGTSGEEVTIGGLNYLLKRIIDVFGALIGLAFLLLASPFVIVAIRLSSTGKVLFRHQRVGQAGRPFTMYKFRTMASGAEMELDDLIDVGRLDEPAFKLERDPRVTKVGAFLRRWSLDETPQFWNVLRGQMSLVGPRPEETRIVALYNNSQRRRLSVKPGMTGPMQVAGRADLSLNERVALEVEYIEHYSLWRDLKIIARTFPAVIRGDGAR